MHLSNSCNHDSSSYLQTLHKFSSSFIQFLHALTPFSLLILVSLFHFPFFLILFRFSGSPFLSSILYHSLPVSTLTYILHSNLILYFSSSHFEHPTFSLLSLFITSRAQACAILHPFPLCSFSSKFQDFFICLTTIYSSPIASLNM